jgi:hypothetical protein
VSYLASLARPAEAAIRPAAEPAPAARAETFGEVHEEVFAAPREAASEATEARVDRSGDRVPSVVDTVEVRVASPAAALEPTTRPRSSNQPLRPLAAPVTLSTPTAARPRPAPAADDAAKHVIDMTSPREAPSPPARRVSEPVPVVRAKTEPPTPEPYAPPAPILPAADRGPGREGPALERTPPLTRASTTTLPVRSREPAHKPAVLAAPAPTSRPEVNVHIGAISLTVKAPAAPAAAARPSSVPMAQPLPAAVPPRSRDGLAFSASRHYLRWS